MRAVCRIKGSTNHALRLACLWECGKFFEIHGIYGPAIEAIDGLEALARRSGDSVWIRKSHTLGGIIHADFGNVAEALIRHAKSLEMAPAEGIAIQIAALANAAGALIYGGLHREAITCCERAIEISSRDSTPLVDHNAGFAYCNMAVAHLYLEQFPQGLRAIRKSLARTKPPKEGGLAFSCTTREWTFIQLALELGLIKEAQEHALTCRMYSRKWGDNPRLAGMALLAEGLCEVHAGNVSSGLAILEKVLTKVSGLNRITVHEDARRALIKAYEVVGQPHRALEHLTALVTEIRARKERILSDVLGWRPAVEFDDSVDSRPLEHREAKLRARVAEIELINSRLEMLERLAITADLKEESSGQHGYRVGKLAALLAAEVGMKREAHASLEIAARLHDIGKIGVPDRILLTSQELKDAERHLISSHTLIGAELLAKSDIPQLRVAEDIARCHHEWWNGTGYPSKLSGKRIPIHARIVALADVFDALTHGRPYAPAWPVEKALEEIQARRGTQFDPELTDRFVELIHKLTKEHPDLDEFLSRAGRNSPFAQARNRIRLMLEEGRGRVRDQTVEASTALH